MEGNRELETFSVTRTRNAKALVDQIRRNANWVNTLKSEEQLTRCELTWDRQSGSITLNICTGIVNDQYACPTSGTFAHLRTRMSYRQRCGRNISNKKHLHPAVFCEIQNYIIDGAISYNWAASRIGKRANQNTRWYGVRDDFEKRDKYAPRNGWIKKSAMSRSVLSDEKQRIERIFLILDFCLKWLIDIFTDDYWSQGRKWPKAISLTSLADCSGRRKATQPRTHARPSVRTLNYKYNRSSAWGPNQPKTIDSHSVLRDASKA